MDGFRKKQPIQILDDTGRALRLTYHKATQLKVTFSAIPKKLFDFGASPWAELLKRVEGTSGYQSGIQL